MPRSPLTLYRFLDPRPADAAQQAPYPDAVNIPLDELPQRTHELPPADEQVGVVGPAELAQQTVAYLASIGRRARVDPDAPTDPLGKTSPPGRLWRPNELLAHAAAQLPPGAALDLGCGTGRDAVYLASLGWRITAVDGLPDALARGAALAGRYTSLPGSITWVEQDLDRGDWPGRIAGVSPPGGFDLVLLARFWRPGLLGRCAEWLRPGGSIVVDAFTTLHRDRHGRPARCDDVVGPGELEALLATWRVREYSEEWRGRIHTARAWATK